MKNPATHTLNDIDLNTCTHTKSLIMSTLKAALPTQSNSSVCMFDRIYSAACYANLSYVFSNLHGDTLESIAHEDTVRLIQLHQKTVIAVYDNVDNPNVGAIIIPLENEAIIAFHGTNFLRKDDHITNFESNLIPSKYAPGLYHAGFLRLSNIIVPKIIKVLRSHYGPLHLTPSKILVYGHSMGSALAQLLTQYLQHHFQNIQLETIIFGSPKVMCPIAAQAYDQENKGRTIRVESPLDLVIYMPTQFMGYGVVNSAVLLHPTSSDIGQNHRIEGYLSSVHTLRQQFRNQGIACVSLDNYAAASARFNPIHPWMQYSSLQPSQSSLSEFIHLMGHGLSKGIQSIIRALPFK